jgi:hypothetical protein
MGKSLSSDSARGLSEKQQEEASRRAAPDARECIPTAGRAARSYHFYCAYQRFNFNQKQRSSCQSFFRTLLGQEWLLGSAVETGSRGPLGSRLESLLWRL